MTYTQLKAQGPSRTCNESKEEAEDDLHEGRNGLDVGSMPPAGQFGRGRMVPMIYVCYFCLNVVRSSPPRVGVGVPILPTLPTLHEARNGLDVGRMPPAGRIGRGVPRS